MGVVRLYGDAAWCGEPAVMLGHDGPAMAIPKGPLRDAVRAVHPNLRLPLFEFDTSHGFVRVDEALMHLSFAPDGSLVAVDICAAYELAKLVLTHRKLKKVAWPKDDAPFTVTSLKLRQLNDDVQKAFAQRDQPPLDLPKARLLSAVTTKLRCEDVAVKTNPCVCAIRRCGNKINLGKLVPVCPDHVNWTLLHPIPCAPHMTAALPQLEAPLLHLLIGQRGVYFASGECSTNEDALRRGRLVAAGKYLDDMFLLLGNQHKYGMRCEGLLSALNVQTGTLVTMMQTTQLLMTTKHSSTGFGAFKAMVNSLAVYGYALNIVPHTNAIAKVYVGSGAAPAQLIGATHEGSKYLLSAVTVVCIRRLWGGCNLSFTYRVVAGRALPSASYVVQLDAANPDPLIIAALRQVQPSEEVAVLNSEFLSWGLLMAISECYGPVTFSGSPVAACGFVNARHTGEPIGFVWHCVVQAAKHEANSAGRFFTGSAVLSDDYELRALIDPKRLGVVDSAIGDPLGDVFTARMNDVDPHPSSAKQIYGGLAADQAADRFHRYRNILQSLCLALKNA